jgi:hypothetical protein
MRHTVAEVWPGSQGSLNSFLRYKFCPGADQLRKTQNTAFSSLCRRRAMSLQLDLRGYPIRIQAGALVNARQRRLPADGDHSKAKDHSCIIKIYFAPNDL